MLLSLFLKSIFLLNLMTVPYWSNARGERNGAILLRHTLPYLFRCSLLQMIFIWNMLFFTDASASRVSSRATSLSAKYQAKIIQIPFWKLHDDSKLLLLVHLCGTLFRRLKGWNKCRDELSFVSYFWQSFCKTWFVSLSERNSWTFWKYVYSLSGRKLDEKIFVVLLFTCSSCILVIFWTMSGVFGKNTVFCSL